MRLSPTDLTRHHALARRFFTRDLLSGREVPGYTAMDLFKFYGMLAGLFFALAYTYTRYWELFNDIQTAGPAWQLFVLLFSGIPLLLILPALLGFLWWASGALVEFARWQRVNRSLWRWFWFAVLNFYTWVLLDLLDKIHPAMSRNGLAKAPNLVLLFSGKLEWFPFQWGYFLLYFMAAFLLLACCWSYLGDAWREVWFYTQRMHRYGASVLTGFSQTAAVAASAPVTESYPQVPARLPSGFRGAPRLNPAIESLSAEQAGQLIAADSSGAILSSPRSPAALFVDLGRYVHDSRLELITDAMGRPLLVFDGRWPAPQSKREELVVPLKRSGS